MSLDLDTPPEAANVSASNKTLYAGAYSCSFTGSFNAASINQNSEMAMDGLVKLKSTGNGVFTKGRFVNTTNQPDGTSSTCSYNLNTTDSGYITYKNGRQLNKLIWVFDADLSTDQTAHPGTCAINGFTDFTLAQPTSFGYQNNAGKVLQVANTSDYIHLNDLSDDDHLIKFIGGGHCNRLSRDIE